MLIQGGKLHTQYNWYWGDGTPNVTVTGYDSNRYQNHTYHHPGTHTVTVTATNDGGAARVDKTITVLG